jgi:TRAP-type mannitol/chloroaromatic compound transport system substrate-binding protein
MKDVQFIAKTGGIKKYHPDYLSLSAYAYAVLLYLEAWHPEAEKVDFIVERNGCSYGREPQGAKKIISVATRRRADTWRQRSSSITGR